MNFLKSIFEKQIELQKRVNVGDTSCYALMLSNNILDREKMSLWNILAMHAELSELLELTNWKVHKKTRVVYDENRVKEMHIELIDILHFWINLCIIWGLQPEKIIELYNEKNKENHDRQNRGY